MRMTPVTAKVHFAGSVLTAAARSLFAWIAAIACSCALGASQPSGPMERIGPGFSGVPGSATDSRLAARGFVEKMT